MVGLFHLRIASMSVRRAFRNIGFKVGLLTSGMVILTTMTDLAAPSWWGSRRLPLVTIGMLVNLPVGCALAWWLSRLITRNLNTIAAAIEALASGAPIGSMPVTARDQTGDLARA